MTIFVDDSIFPYRGQKYCHMVSDESLEELHAFALRIGLRRRWFQNTRRHPHYDLSPAKRQAAIINGAVEVSCERLVEIVKTMAANVEEPTP